MNRKEAMEKEIKFSDLVGLWKYLKPFKPVWEKLVHDWAYLCEDDVLLSALGLVCGLATLVLGAVMVLSSFHLFFFVTIPAGLIIGFAGLSGLYSSLLGLASKCDHDKRRFNLAKWEYKVEK